MRKPSRHLYSLDTLYVGDVVWLHVNYNGLSVRISSVITDNTQRFDVASTSKVGNVGELSQTQETAGALVRHIA